MSEREKQKKSKYQELAADLATQWLGYMMMVTPVVVGDLGLVRGLKKHLTKMGLLTSGQIEKLVKEMQLEALSGAIWIIKRHMTYY